MSAKKHGARHHPIVRITHWVSAIALFVMAGSGLRIFNASPAFAPKGGHFAWWPWEGTPAPANLTFGGWLGGARHWHFAMMWLLVANGVLYLGYLWFKGEWRELAPLRGSIHDALQMAKFYLGLTKRHPHQGKHNALQKYAYSTMIVLGVVSVSLVSRSGSRCHSAGWRRPWAAIISRAGGTSRRCSVSACWWWCMW